MLVMLVMLIILILVPSPINPPTYLHMRHFGSQAK